jgi:hydrogenase nickel incorporation protein HypB
MEAYKVIKVKQSVLADNDSDADKLRIQFKKQGTFLFNLMSSPGS